MRTTIILIIAAMAISSCATQKNCIEKWPPQINPIDTIIEYEIHDTIIYRDTTITITLPGETDTAWIELPQIDDSGESAYSADTAKAETELAQARSWIENEPGRPARIILQLEQKETDLQVRLDSAIQDRDRYREEITTIRQTYEKPVYHPSKWHKFTAVSFWILLPLLLIYIAFTFLVIAKKR